MLVWSAWHAYSITRDPLHPLIYIAPLCVYAYVYKPLSLAHLGVLDAFFENKQLLLVQAVNLIGVAAFCAGAMRHVHQVSRISVPSSVARSNGESWLTPAVRHRTTEIAWLLGTAAVATYWYMVFSAGGLSAAYARAKGGVTATSGYISEMPMLSLSAIGLLYLAWSGKRITLSKLVLLLLVSSPLIVHGLLGARRGPTFMVLATLSIGGYAVSLRRPKLLTVFVTTFLLGSLLLFLVNNRQRIFLGSTVVERWIAGDEPVAPANLKALGNGEDWVFSAGTVLTSRESGTHYWGRRLIANLIIRPIPRQLWPQKYIDTGFDWMDTQEEMGGMADNQWLLALGWSPPRGAAAGFVADLFLEFSYLSFIACYVFGWLYSYLWRRAVLDRGEWSILYLFAAVLSIYVPTQSVSAWTYRFVFLSVPTMVLWRLMVQPVVRDYRRINTAQPAPL